MYNLFESLRLYFRPSPSTKIQTFTRELATFKEVGKDVLLAVSEPLKLLENTFAQNVRLNHPREIYPVYHALNAVSNNIAKSSLDSVKMSWQKILRTLHHRKIYKIGIGESLFDTSVALNILETGSAKVQQKISIGFIDTKNEKNREEVINYIRKIDFEAFGACFQTGFLNEILKAADIRCFIARNDKNEIIGVLWGFFTKDQSNQELFHFWELSRNASMAQMGIATALINYAKQQQHLYPNLKFATLNVNPDNMHAKKLYESEKFASVNEQEKEATKIFMSNKLSPEQTTLLSPEVAKNITKDFVMRTVPLHKLIGYELMRRCELVWRNLWYR